MRDSRHWQVPTDEEPEDSVDNTYEDYYEDDDEYYSDDEVTPREEDRRIT